MVYRKAHLFIAILEVESISHTLLKAVNSKEKPTGVSGLNFSSIAIRRHVDVELVLGE